MAVSANENLPGKEEVLMGDMKTRTKALLKAYGGIITKNLPLFLAVGVVNILFSERGWFPGTSMQAFGTYLYQLVIPLFLAYSAGQKAGAAADPDGGGNAAGLSAVLAAGCLVAGQAAGVMFWAILAGAAAGWLTGYFWRHFSRRCPAGFEMIGHNLVVTALGILTGGIFIKGVALLTGLAGDGIERLVAAVFNSRLLFLSNLLIEPLKVLFLNNWLNHGILVPLGMEQLQTTGQSVLFLVESNPGPGLGILLACWLARKEKRNGLAAGMAAEFFGGIHELYFPYVLSDLRLLGAVVAGGMCGTFLFGRMGAGLLGPVSPGSILTILMMGSADRWAGILLGVGVSALVTVALAFGILKSGGKDAEADISDMPGAEDASEAAIPVLPENIRRIYVVCDAGLGSSAMGAALLRRRLQAEGIVGITVQAAAFDELPEDGDLLVCQRDFYEKQMKGRADKLPAVYPVEQLAGRDVYKQLAEDIKGRVL